MLRLRVALLVLPLAALDLGAQQQRQPAAASRRGVTPEDYYAFTFVADPRLSPDGSRVAYVVTRIDRGKNRRLPSIWVASADGRGAPRQVVDESHSPGAPRWSPDGRTIAFTSGRAPPGDSAAAGAAAVATGATSTSGAQPAPPVRPQLWTVPSAGGAPRRVSSVANGVSSCSWSPDGVRFVCLVRTGASDTLNRGPERSDVRHYSRIIYKFNDTGWFDDKRNHLWLIEAATGAARQLTSGDDWNDTEPQWSPDGARVAFVSDRTGREYDDNWTSDVWTIPVGGGELSRVSDGTGRNRTPAWSPDGRTIAFLNNRDRGEPPTILLAPSGGGGTPVAAARDLDLIPSSLQWGERGRAIFFDAGVRGEAHVFRVDVAAGTTRPVTAGVRGVRSPNVLPALDRMVYLANDFKHLDDVYGAALDGKQERKLTDVNAALWTGLDLASVERMTYAGADGWPIDGFFARPLGWTAGRKYPLLLNIHGGPAAQYGVDWYHEFQGYAAKGYAVFFTNPRGSTGYGRKFQRAIENEWGGKDYVDVMNGVRAVIAANPWIDTTRLGVTGGSYGGYLTNWIVGHSTRFKAAVTLRSVTNFVSDEGTRDGAYGHEEDFGGHLFEKFDLYWERSPLRYAKDVTTPILILHSENDLRVPLEQGEQWFRALKLFGKTAELVIFPRENHNLTRTGEPRHVVESLNWQLWWFDRYLNGNANAVAPDGGR